MHSYTRTDLHLYIRDVHIYVCIYIYMYVHRTYVASYEEGRRGGGPGIETGKLNMIG